MSELKTWLTDKIEVHKLRAGDCPPNSLVVLASALARLLEASPAPNAAPNASAQRAEPVAWYRDVQVDANEDSQGLPPRYFTHRSVHAYPQRPIGEGWKPLCDPATSASPAPKLTVFYGAMPESNGKSNWTAILHAGAIEDGITLDRSEHPDRVRYEADRARYLIGELAEKPCIVDYDADKHSGYVAPARAGASPAALTDAQEQAILCCINDYDCEPAIEPNTRILDGLRSILAASQADTGKGE
ncbi:hypothetical protein LJR296_001401 [Cupriavidus necator]|uniref:hypothetical protein n=1 Tax=Cupriavidus necator TaxID=106590 RepID=UPI003ECD9F17